MSSSDEEGEFLPNCVTDYEFVDQTNEHVSLACLPLLWQKDELIGSVSMRVFVSGSCDNGLQKIYKEVVAWRFELSYVQPEISVLCKGRGWMKLLKPRRLYEFAIRSILVTVHCLHFVKHNLEAAEESLWTHLSRVFSYYEDAPGLYDCTKHVPVIKDAADHDQRLKDSEFIQRILSGQPMQRNVEQAVGIPTESSEFIVDEDTDDLGEDDEFSEEEEDLFDACCSLCDNGGDLLFCEGRCMRSFHVRGQIGDHGEETCEGLGLSQAQVKSMPQFFCQNCQYQRHQCSVCGKLGSSDVTSNAEVFPCIAGSCGRFYHPACVSNEFQQRNETQIENFEDRIAAGDSFVCPAHKCVSCKQIENIKIPEMQFAVCRRCPKAYHRKCLPREIMFATEEESDILPRAWDGLLPKRILMYCMNHEIVPELGTPLRNHICFPRRLKMKIHASGKTVTVEHKKEIVDHTSLVHEPATVNTKKQAASELPRVVDKHICGPSFDGHKRDSSSNLTNASAAHLKKFPKREHTEDINDDTPNMLPKRENTEHASNVYLSGPVMRRPEEKKKSPVKHGNLNIYGDKHNALHSAKPFTKKQCPSTPVGDIEMERRMAALIEEVDSSFDEDEFLKQQNLTSMYNLNSKDMIVQNLTKGLVEAAVKAIRGADQILSSGGSVEDAKAACSVELIRKVPMWKKKLKGFLGPFMHGMHYSSFGRHFTKTEKLLEIVNRLHNYVQDGDMIVDFCCGSNEFSSLMKEKLDSVGKTKCSFKNFDLFPSKNDFNFEQRDWFTVNPNELPPGSKLVMGLNPPFGYNAALANKFIDKALQFKPKLLILIVPPETKRLDSWNRNRRNLRYDLLWEDQNLLAGESFYLPGAFDKNAKNISQWNNTPPPLYLWSHPDWTLNHRDIAIRCGHSRPPVAPESIHCSEFFYC